MAGGVLDALEADLALAHAAGTIAGRESLCAIARDLALRLEHEDEPLAAAALARILRTVLVDLGLGVAGDDWEDFLNELRDPTGGVP